MDLYSLFETSKDAETDGVVIDYGQAGKFTIARAGGSNQGYSKALQAMYKANKHQIDTETMPDDVAEKKTLEIFCKHVLRGWEGVKDRKGELLEFSQENAIKLMTDLKDLYADLRAQSTKISNFRAQAIEEDAKN